MAKKPTAGFYSFSCCEGCQFTILFLDNLPKILDKFDIKHFHLIKDKNMDAKIDVAFVEGAITTKKQVRKLKDIRKKAKVLVALGECATHGGIPSMRNFIENDQLEKYVYNQRMLKDSIKASGIGRFVKVDYYMYGCPITKSEFTMFVDSFLKGEILKEKTLPICTECSRRGKNCFLQQKQFCLGPVTRSGCDAICTRENIPCTLCRGPVDKVNIAKEAELFHKFGLSKKDAYNKIRRFKDIE